MVNRDDHIAPDNRGQTLELDEIFKLGNSPLFNIKAVEQATGVRTSTLRAWERRHGILAPERTDSGYRLYSQRDIALIRWLKHQLEHGMTISHAVALMNAQTSHEHVPALNLQLVDASPLAEAKSRLREALLDLNETMANVALGEAFSRWPVEMVCLRIIAPIMVEIGDGWARGEVSIAEEHFATHYVRQKLLSLMASASHRSTGRPILTASAPDDHHELGILFVALFLQRAGWEVIHLGPNLAAEGLVDTLIRLRPALLAVSATHEEAARNILDIAHQVELVPPPRPVLGFGGQAFNDNPSMQALIPGVYLGRNADETVETVERLMRERSSTL
ncbi:MAG: MerR family transcriptional regulator [Anaerolineae bacterium]